MACVSAETMMYMGKFISRIHIVHLKRQTKPHPKCVHITFSVFHKVPFEIYICPLSGADGRSVQLAATRGCRQWRILWWLSPKTTYRLSPRCQCTSRKIPGKYCTSSANTLECPHNICIVLRLQLMTKSRFFSYLDIFTVVCDMRKVLSRLDNGYVYDATIMSS